MDANDDSSHPQLRPELMEAKSYAVSGMVLMVPLMVLFALFLFGFAVYIYMCLFWRQPTVRLPRRRHVSARRSRLSFVGEDPLTIRSVGLDKSVIDSLPIFVFKSENFRDGLECAVCLCEFEKNEKGRMLPRCSHSFHTECIDMWFHSHSTCPLCRTSAKPGPPSNAHVESGHTEQISSNTSSTEEPISSNVTEVHGNHICQHLEEGQASSGAVQQQRTRNALFWGSKNQIKERGQGSSAMLQITIEIPNRSNSFSYPGEKSQIDSPKSPLQSLKRMLSRGRDGKVFPSTP
eukprot:Gb_04642 [translate_table: standard]